MWRWLGTTVFDVKGERFKRFLDRVLELVRIPPPDTPKLLQRVALMERDIVLPLKAAGIAMLLYSFYRSQPWMTNVLSELEIAIESTQYFLWIYIAINAVVAALLLNIRRVPLAVIEWAVFVVTLVDGVFLSALTLVTGGYDSILYWLFLALIARTSISVPRATSQLMLNLTLSACYMVAGAIDISIAEHLESQGLYLLERPAAPTEPLVLRLTLLLLMTLCCYAVQVLLERQRQAEEEAREFAVREGQLHSAGRLAAEIAHQIKNPLAIINNAAFSLERALRDGKPLGAEQIRIIKEEVERSDRIITQIMGYAQLSEGRVEKLSVVEELDRAIAQVFPPGSHYDITIERHYAADFPPLLMQRRHVSETFVNLLQNAREALDGKNGKIKITALCRRDFSTEVSITDNGPGIPPEKHESIFEAYYTTKEKGTGLGLATVKHNVELYGGKVRLESELGKGARFTLLFPARTLMRLDTNI
jgi:signal transduction histidine kinase